MFLNIVVSSEHEKHIELLNQISKEIRITPVGEISKVQLVPSMELKTPTHPHATTLTTPPIYFYFDQNTKPTALDQAHLNWIAALFQLKLAKYESSQEFFKDHPDKSLLERYVESAVEGIIESKKIKKAICFENNKPGVSTGNSTGFFKNGSKPTTPLDPELAVRKRRAENMLKVGVGALLLSIPLGFLTVAGSVFLAVIGVICIVSFAIRLKEMATLELANEEARSTLTP